MRLPRWGHTTRQGVCYRPIPLKHSPVTRVRSKTARFQHSLKLETCGYHALVAFRPVRNPGNQVFSTE